KEPQHRYPSMLELARDLARYLAGEPLITRRSGWAQRLVRRARRHKALTLMAAATVLSLALALGQTLLHRHRAARRTELAAELGQEIQRIDTFVHVAHALPLHDVRREHRVIGGRITDLAMRLYTLDPQLQGPVLYALGRGHLALQAPERAAAYLEEALAYGYDTPEVHYSLGRALGQRYMLEAAQARRHPDPAEVDRRLRRLEAQYLAGARAHLERAQPQALTVDSRAYVEALAHYLGRDFATARERAARAQREAPWRYEAFALEGDIYSAEAEQAFGAGHYDRAADRAERAIAPYQRALDMARSDPDLRLSRARAWHLITLTQRLRGADLAAPAEHLRQEAEGALAANPDAVAGYQYLAAAHLSRARHLTLRDVDPRPVIQLGLAALGQAFERRADDSTSLSLAAELSVLQGQYLMNFGDDPRPTYARALDYIRRGLALDPHDAFLWRTCVNSQVAQMQYETRHGIDPRPRLTEVRRCSREGLAQTSLAPTLWLGLSQAHFTAAQYVAGLGQDPRPLLAEAHEAIARATALDPHPAAELGFPAHFYSLEARYLLGEGQDAGPTLAAGLAAAERSLALLPRSANALMALTRLAGLRAQSLVEQDGSSGRDFGAAIAAGQVAAERWQMLQPRLPERFAFEAYLDMAQARWHLHRRRRAEARPHLLRAIALLQQGLALQGRNAFFHSQLAEAYLLCATDMATTPALAREHLDRGLAIIAQGLGVNPHQPNALALQGALLWARARLSRTPAEETRLAERARLSFEAALARNPGLARQYRPSLDDIRAFLGRRPTPLP
ncbi:MAG TPA: hypothetical protein VH877_17000, partial [Polyangia bacterium]|nr:hypothetical protein [Polyangia bacterium]